MKLVAAFTSSRSKRSTHFCWDELDILLSTEVREYENVPKINTQHQTAQ